MCTQQTSGLLHELRPAPEIATSASSSSCFEPFDAPSELERSPIQDELSPVATSESPVAAQPSLNTDAVEEPDLLLKSGK